MSSMRTRRQEYTVPTDGTAGGDYPAPGSLKHQQLAADEIERKRAKQAGKVYREQQRLKTRLGNFKYHESPVWKSLYQRYGPHLGHNELTSIAELICETEDLRLDRDAKRRKVVLVKWFEEHWDVIERRLDFIALE